jgi:hypothetical protein
MQGVGSPQSNTLRLTAESRRSEDGLSNPNSSSPKRRDADAETRPQAQRKGIFSLPRADANEQAGVVRDTKQGGVARDTEREVARDSVVSPLG